MKKGLIAITIILSLVSAKAYAVSFEADRAESGKVFAEFFDAKAAAAPVVTGDRALSKSAMAKATPATVTEAVKPALATKIPELPRTTAKKRSGDFMDFTIDLLKPLVALAVIAGSVAGVAIFGVPGALLGLGVGAAIVAGLGVATVGIVAYAWSKM